MKLHYVFIFCIFALALYLHFSDLSLDYVTGEVTKEKQNSYVIDSGFIQVYFCPHQDCVTPLANLIESAQESVHCAFFELDLEQVQERIVEKHQEGLDVKVVTDEQYLYEFNHSFVVYDSWGLMHNKFCIIDGQRISSGSMNPTSNGAYKNNNNLLIIESKTLAQNYEAEFKEMWEGTFKKGKRVNVPHIVVSNSSIHNYFCPDDHCVDKIKQELSKAKKSIHVMAFSFTSQGIANILLLKKRDGISVSGVFEARQVTKYSVYDRLLANGMNVTKDGNKQNMHHKVFIIDRKTVITGSMNPTDGGDTRNDENVLIIEDERVARLFLEEFDRVWAQAKASDN